YNLKAYRSCTTITLHTWVMAQIRNIRTGRHCAFAIHVHLVSVTKFRHMGVHRCPLRQMEEIMRAVSAGFACEPVEFNAEGNHAHLLLNFPPQVTVTTLGDSLKGVFPRRLRQKFPDLVRPIGGTTNSGPGPTSPTP
ncbi:IS200/IS605 family transposase, partial [Streptomyces sp. NPDC056121]|uniref:IS200/IS605 family transposase n=1 Tax=Streptomyces sp. NPDC056121 TaxID=3345718 RepID=UPI0035D541DE